MKELKELLDLVGIDFKVIIQKLENFFLNPNSENEDLFRLRSALYNALPDARRFLEDILNTLQPMKMSLMYDDYRVMIFDEMIEKTHAELVQMVQGRRISMQKREQLVRSTLAQIRTAEIFLEKEASRLAEEELEETSREDLIGSVWMDETDEGLFS